VTRAQREQAEDDARWARAMAAADAAPALTVEQRDALRDLLAPTATFLRRNRGGHRAVA
jgi:hypothetical protein